MLWCLWNMFSKKKKKIGGSGQNNAQQALRSLSSAILSSGGLYQHQESVYYGRMAEILVQRACSHEFTRLTAITWIFKPL
ncbi:hypothetical protein P8452_53273 [Trifolium repens]|nr:hypothetical protein P8452_53273 [Trifolium repens]